MAIAQATPSIISMDFGNGRDDSHFRIRSGHKVKYVTTLPRTLSVDTLDDMPLNFEAILPLLDYGGDGWTHASVFRDAETGELAASLSSPAMAGVESVWHPEMIDMMDLDKIKTWSMLVQLCRYHPSSSSSSSSSSHVDQDEAAAVAGPTTRVAVAKMARFEWEVAYIEGETRGYKLLEGTGLAPRFLGHVHEGGRVMGVLLELLEGGRPAGVEDLAACSEALGRLHAMGILHGDTNRHNFLVFPGGGGDGRKKVVILDFEKHKEGASRDELDAEMEGLKAQLEEETGRGAGFPR
ncbi:hypothetical protein RB600_005347 [Gaeumannomyces tritici]